MSGQSPSRGIEWSVERDRGRTRATALPEAPIPSAQIGTLEQAPPPVARWAAGPASAEAWASLVRVTLLLLLIPAVLLGAVTVPQPGASGIVVVLGAYVVLLAIGPRRMPILARTDLVLVLDLLVVTALLLVSGELSSPFLYLYYLVILEAAVRLNLRQALAASIAAASVMILLWERAGQAQTLETVGFRLGAFMAGGFLLALFLGVLVQEHRARREQIRWAALLDERLRDATRQLEVQLAELQFYNDLAARLSGELRVEGVLEILLGIFLDTAGISQGLAYAVGEDDRPRLSVTQGIAGDAGRDGPDHLLPLPPRADAGDVLLLPTAPGAGVPGRHAVCVPLVRAGFLRAWLCGLVEDPPLLTEPVRRRLGGVAAQGVSALEAARLHEEVQRMIRADPMRSLCSWAGLEHLVSDEVDRCRTLLLVFSIAEIQIEDYGTSHADAADRDLALRHAVKLLQGPLRRVDVLAGDGAGRFGVLLPRMPKVRAVETVQALIERLEADSVASKLLGVEHVALTAGVVTFPEDGATASSLLGAVERLLVLGPSYPARVQIPVS